MRAPSPSAPTRDPVVLGQRHVLGQLEDRVVLAHALVELDGGEA
jgi:hypothetical protein